MLVLVRSEDDTPPAYTLAVSSLPLSALQRFHVTTKRVFSHFVQALEDEIALVLLSRVKLFGGAFGQPDGPGHGVAGRVSRGGRDEARLPPYVRPFPLGM